uniref:SJCHGC06875 protein n=1 Tax=Schistosoma japonicum TaxID=6182 RepID=Q5DEA0_SCHJA|nr:SJCHGC06875 protein [Schistosoma japonicum]
MYFRASSPEWRDVAEKFIGRHVAYHHHYVSNYALGGGSGSGSSHKSIFIRPTCYPLQVSHDQGGEQIINDEAECRIVDAINQLNLSLEKCLVDNKLAQSLLVSARSVASSVQISSEPQGLLFPYHQTMQWRELGQQKVLHKRVLVRLFYGVLNSMYLLPPNTYVS